MNSSLTNAFPEHVDIFLVDRYIFSLPKMSSNVQV